MIPAEVASKRDLAAILCDCGSGRRILYEVDPDRDEFRYVLEYDKTQLVFPAL